MIAQHLAALHDGFTSSAGRWFLPYSSEAGWKRASHFHTFHILADLERALVSIARTAPYWEAEVSPRSHHRSPKDLRLHYIHHEPS